MKNTFKCLQRLLIAGLVFVTCGASAQELKWTPEPGGVTAPSIGSIETRHWVDVNGDGRDDFCAFSGTDNKFVVCYFATDNGFSKLDVNFQVRDMWGVKPFQWIDLNGDGRVDLCRVDRDNNPGWNINCYLNRYPESADFLAIETLNIPKYRTYKTYTPDCRPQDGCDGTINYVKGVDKQQDFFFTDVDGDGSGEVCYVNQATPSEKSLACRTFSGSTFSVETPKWTSGLMAEGTYARGFYDFNGDGYRDYCALHGGNLVQCTLTSSNGLVGAQVVQSIQTAHWYSSHGAAFVDINGDGNTDFCAPLDNRNGEVSCLLSNGRSWAQTQLLFSGIDHGHIGFRWWTDVNGDGVADYCRVPNSAPKPRSPTYDPSAGDVYSTLSCRLGQIGSDANVFGKSLFASSDLEISGVNFGAGTGLSFCSASGNGIQSLCRVTNLVTPAIPVCTPNPNPNREPTCTPPYTNQTGFAAGIPGVNQANPALMRSLDDGLAAQTRLTYLSMTDARVYRRSNAGNGPRQQIIQGTSPLVYESRAWLKESDKEEKDWKPLTGTARYYYMDMMTDVVNGNRGFRERFMLTEGSNTIDHVVFFQGRGKEVDVSSRMDDPLEVGVAKLRSKFVIDPQSIQVPAVANGASYRQRYLDAVMAQAAQTTTSTVNVPVWMGAIGWVNVPFTTSSTRLKRAADAEANSDDGAFLLVQRSLNELADTASPAGEVLPTGTPAINPRVRYVGKSSTAAFDLNGTTSIRLPSTIASTKQNAFGNVWEQVQTTQQTGTAQGTLEWTKTTTSTYADDHTKWNLGRMTGSTVVSTAPAADKQLALFARSAGTSPNATTISGTGPTPPPVPPAPLAPGVLSAILQLLLED